MSVMTESSYNSASVWLYSKAITINGSGSTTSDNVLATAGTYVNKDIQIHITTSTPSAVYAANTASASITKVTADGSNAGINIQAVVAAEQSAEPTSGYYIAFTATGSGSSKITTAGWIGTGNLTAATVTTDTKYFPITAAQFTTSGNKVYCSTAGYVPKGSTSNVVGTVSTGTITNNTTLPSGSSSSGTINRGSYIKIGSGYYSSTKYYLAQANSGNVTITQQSGQSVDGYATATVQQATYGAGTATATLVTTDSSSSSGINISGVIGAQVTAEPNDGSYFFAITAAGYSHINNAGWVAGNTNLTSASATKYFPVTAATFNNTIADGLTDNSYTDISNTDAAPVLTSNGYLYITAGYVPNTKISLEKLIPDEATATAGTQILSGYSAYDKDGKLLSGTIPTKTATNVTVTGAWNADAGKYRVTATVPVGYYATQVVKSADVPNGTITNNTTLPSGSSSSGTLNRTKYIKIAAGYYNTTVYYAAWAPSGNIELTQQTGTNVTEKATASVRSAVVAAGTSSASIAKSTATSGSGANITSQLGNEAASTTASYYIALTATGAGCSNVTTSGWVGTGELANASTTTDVKYYSVPAGAATVTARANVSGAEPTITWNASTEKFTANYATGNISVAGKITTTGWVVKDAAITSANVSVTRSKEYAVSSLLTVYDGTYT